MRGNGGNNGQGSKWCDKGVDDGATLSLDHLWARINGGTNHNTNLVTACVGCNAARRDRKWFAGLVKERRAFILRMSNRQPQRAWAAELLRKSRGSVRAASTRMAALGL